MKKYAIREFAERSGVSPDRLRHYEKLGLLQPQRQEQNQYRFYTDNDLLDLQTICVLHSINVPLKEMKEDKSAYSPESMKEHVCERIDSLRDQIAVLENQLHTLEAVRMRLPEMNSSAEACRTWHAIPRYVLYYDEATPDLIAFWTSLMPHTASFFSIDTQQMASSDQMLTAKPGLEIVKNWAEQIQLPIQNPVHAIGGFDGVRTVLQVRDPLHPTKEDFAPVYRFLEQNNLEPNGDWLYGMRGSENTPEGKMYHIRVMVPYKTK